MNTDPPVPEEELPDGEDMEVTYSDRPTAHAFAYPEEKLVGLAAAGSLWSFLSMHATFAAAKIAGSKTGDVVLSCAGHVDAEGLMPIVVELPPEPE